MVGNRCLADGQYATVQRLPSEAQLVHRFGVSRPTAARVLRDLQSEGVIERRAGAGSFLTGVLRQRRSTWYRVILEQVGIRARHAWPCSEAIELLTMPGPHGTDAKVCIVDADAFLSSVRGALGE